MGREYNINFEIDDDEEVEAILKSLPYFEAITVFENRNLFIYRLPDNSDEMPSCFAEIESRGIYFCDNGSTEILREMIFRIGLRYKKLEIIDHSD